MLVRRAMHWRFDVLVGCVNVNRHASEGLCFRSRPIPRLPDLVWPTSLHLVLERYRVLAGAVADRGQFGCRSPRPPQSEAFLGLLIAL